MKIDDSIIWFGDLDDDCTAIWNGLILRAEWMDKLNWWWAVSVNDGRQEEIDSSNNYDVSCIGGEKARRFAEQAAIKYLTEVNIADEQELIDIIDKVKGKFRMTLIWSEHIMPLPKS